RREIAMATPNDGPSKKPQDGSGAPAGKGPNPAAGKPPAGKQPPAMGKLVSSGDKASKPAPDKEKGEKKAPVPARAASHGAGGRKLGQVLVDLGYIDDDQLWEILDEAKNTGAPVGQVALNRGLVTEDQLLQALADQFGLRLLNPEDLK